MPGLLEEPVPAPPSAEYETLERPIEEDRNLRRPVLPGADCLNPAVQYVDLLEEGSDQLAPRPSIARVQAGDETAQRQGRGLGLGDRRRISWRRALRRSHSAKYESSSMWPHSKRLPRRSRLE